MASDEAGKERPVGDAARDDVAENLPILHMGQVGLAGVTRIARLVVHPSRLTKHTFVIEVFSSCKKK